MLARKKTIGILILGALTAILGWILVLKKTKHTVQFADYWWNSKFDPDSLQLNRMRTAGVLYLHVFDVDAQPGSDPMPMAELRNFKPKEGLQIIPVIYLTQRALRAMKLANDSKLAINMLRYTEQILGLNRTDWAGFQIDCDWTESSQNRYFEFLKTLKAELKNTTLSATIRLHQIKFREKTGIPPIDRGMLMLYNAGKIETLQRKNSIFEASDVQPYLERLSDYPIKLDYALPAFSWGMVYRMGKIIEILPEKNSDAACHSPFFKKVDLSLYECIESGYRNGFYFLKGDRIKCETVDAQRCKQAAELLHSYLKNDTFTLVFYQAGSPTFMRYDNKDIEAIRSVFN